MAVAKEIRRFHGIFHKMIERCNKKTVKDYKRYGGIGVKSQWTGMQFKEFKELMYSPYLKHAKEHGEKNTTLDRIDPFGNYEEKNIRWATWKQQANNKRYNRLLTFKGKTQTSSQWAEEIGLPVRILLMRIDNSGWSIKRALTEPNNHVKRMLTWKGKTMSMTDWGKSLGIKPGLISYRYKNGETIERILRPRRMLIVYTFNGKKLEVKELAKKTGYSESTIFRLLKGKKYALLHKRLSQTLTTY